MGDLPERRFGERRRSERRRHRARLAAYVFFTGVVALVVGKQVSLTNELKAQQAAKIESDYQACLQGNVDRQSAKDMRDLVVNPNPIDPASIPSLDAPQLAEWFRGAVVFQQARGRKFLADHPNQYAPRDCEAQRKVAGG